MKTKKDFKHRRITTVYLCTIITLMISLAVPVNVHAAEQNEYVVRTPNPNWFVDANGWTFETGEYGYGMDVLNETCYTIVDKVIYDRPVDGNPIAVLPAGQEFTVTGWFERLSLYGFQIASNPYRYALPEVFKIQWNGITGYIETYFQEDIINEAEAADPRIIQEAIVKIQRRIDAYAFMDEVKNSGMTDREKIKAVHDWMCLNIEYDYENYVNDTVPDVSYRVEGAILYRTAVCNGYAETFDMFMELLDIEDRIVTGTATDSRGENGRHAWNKVKLDDVWYYIDVTWDDPVGRGPDYVRYNYFLISEEQMKRDHQWNTTEWFDISNKPDSVTDEQWAMFVETLRSLEVQNP